jgi:hypothetical protein
MQRVDLKLRYTGQLLQHAALSERHFVHRIVLFFQRQGAVLSVVAVSLQNLNFLM